MFKNNFVMCVLHNGNVLDEIDRKLKIPFGSEYKVRLINKNTKRCACDLFMNGEKVGRFILNPGETSDIERFIDGNLQQGKKFTFVDLQNNKVIDNNNFENGIIEAHFYLEKQPEIKEIHHHHDHYHDRYIPYYIELYPYWDHPYKPYNPFYFTLDNTNREIQCTNGGGGTTTSANCNISASNTSNIKQKFNLCSCNEGAIVRGKESSQKFVEVFGYVFESKATILKLKLVNGKLVIMGKYCIGCGRKRKHSDNFCSNCGNKY